MVLLIWMNLFVTKHSIHIIKYNQYFAFFIWIVFFNTFIKISHIIEIFINALESLECFNPEPWRFLVKNWYFASQGSLAYQWILSASGWRPIRSNNEFVFPDSEPPTIKILYGWSGICVHFVSCSFMCSFVTQSNLINFCFFWLYHYIYFLFSYILDFCLFHMQVSHKIFNYFSFYSMRRSRSFSKYFTSTSRKYPL